MRTIFNWLIALGAIVAGAYYVQRKRSAVARGLTAERAQIKLLAGTKKEKIANAQRYGKTAAKSFAKAIELEKKIASKVSTLENANAHTLSTRLNDWNRSVRPTDN